MITLLLAIGKNSVLQKSNIAQIWDLDKKSVSTSETQRIMEFTFLANFVIIWPITVQIMYVIIIDYIVIKTGKKQNRKRNNSDNSSYDHAE